MQSIWLLPIATILHQSSNDWLLYIGKKIFYFQLNSMFVDFACCILCNKAHFPHANTQMPCCNWIQLVIAEYKPVLLWTIPEIHHPECATMPD